MTWRQIRVQMYLNQVFFSQHTEAEVGLRTVREMRTWAAVIDHLMDGQLGALGDVAVQRLKALEASVSEGGWELARHQELIPKTRASITEDEERFLAARAELQATKLRKALGDARQARGSGSHKGPH